MKKSGLLSWLPLGGGVLLAVLALAILFGPFRQEWYYICGDCALRRDTRSRTLFFTPITVWSRHEERLTPLGDLLAAEGLARSHEHRWFAGEGKGYKMYGSGGGKEMRTDAESPRVLALVRALLRKPDRDTAFAWIGFALRPKAFPKDSLDAFLKDENFPDDPAAIDAWLVDGLPRVRARFPKYW